MAIFINGLFLDMRMQHFNIIVCIELCKKYNTLGKPISIYIIRNIEYNILDI